MIWLLLTHHTELTKSEQGTEDWLELTEKTFDFAVYAKHKFMTGDFQVKSGILRALGSNCTLKDGKLDVTLRKQYQLIEKGIEMISAENIRLEPIDFASDKAKTAQYETVFATMSPLEYGTKSELIWQYMRQILLFSSLSSYCLKFPTPARLSRAKISFFAYRRIFKSFRRQSRE